MSTKILAGRYEILEKIGEGGMAAVYKAKCRLLNRFVALKILKPEHVNDTKFVESFRRESQAAASLSHPNIVNVYDVGKDGNIYFIVMEYIEGETLNDIIKREGPLDPDRAVAFTKQVALALDHAHKNHIIHRDVKPHNILITPTGNTKITDFGIARAVTSGTIVNNNAVMGSVHYFSPEQARGGYIDEKSDIYSLGILLYEMVVGKVPFEADNAVAVAMMHMNEEMKRPSDINPRVPLYVEKVILKATQKYQTNRYQSALEMYKALEGHEFSGLMGNFFGDKGDTKIIPNAFKEVTGENFSPFEQVSDEELEKEKEQESMAENTQKQKRKKGTIITFGNKKVRVDFVKLGAIILAIIAAIFMSNLLLAFFGGWGAEEVSVPNLYEMPIEEAEKAITDLGLLFVIENEVEAPGIDPGVVVSQDPLADAKVKEGFTIKVNVTKGVAAVELPSYIGMTEAEAKEKIKDDGFDNGQVTPENSELPIGIVTRQIPQAGSPVTENLKIFLFISQGAGDEKVVVLDFTGEKIDKVKASIQTLGLTLGTVTYENNSSFKVNEVFYQSITGGKEVEKSSTIDLKVSKGEGELTEKAFTFAPPDYSVAKSEVFEMKVYKVQNGNVLLMNDDMHYKSNNGTETVTVKGAGKAKIQVWYDDILVMERNVDFEAAQFTD